MVVVSFLNDSTCVGIFRQSLSGVFYISSCLAVLICVINCVYGIVETYRLFSLKYMEKPSANPGVAGEVIRRLARLRQVNKIPSLINRQGFFNGKK